MLAHVRVIHRQDVPVGDVFSEHRQNFVERLPLVLLLDFPAVTPEMKNAAMVEASLQEMFRQRGPVTDSATG